MKLLDIYEIPKQCNGMVDILIQHLTFPVTCAERKWQKFCKEKYSICVHFQEMVYKVFWHENPQGEKKEHKCILPSYKSLKSVYVLLSYRH